MRRCGHRGLELFSLGGRLDDVIRDEQIIRMRLPERILAAHDAVDAIVEQNRGTLLTDHREIAAFALDFLSKAAL